MRQGTNRGARRAMARLTMGAMGVGFMMALAAPAAHADTCAPLDVQCIAQQGGDTLGGVVDKTKDVAGGAGGTVGGVVQKGTDTVGTILNQGTGGGSGGGTGGGSGGGSGGSGGTSGHHHRGPAGSRTSGGTTSTLDPVTTATAPGEAAKAKLVAHHQHGVLQTIGGTVVRTAKQLSFPIALAVLVGLFVAVQNRMDRHDPKLAVAPLTPDRMRFV
jgi:hypothetical protein